MKTNVQDTSIENYHQNVLPFQQAPQCMRVLDYVSSQFPAAVTRRQIATGLKMEASTVSARVNKLLKDGLLIKVCKVVCPITHITVQGLGLPGQESAA